MRSSNDNGIPSPPNQAFSCVPKTPTASKNKRRIEKGFAAYPTVSNTMDSNLDAAVAAPVPWYII